MCLIESVLINPVCFFNTEPWSLSTVSMVLAVALAGTCSYVPFCVITSTQRPAFIFFTAYVFFTAFVFFTTFVFFTSFSSTLSTAMSSFCLSFSSSVTFLPRQPKVTNPKSSASLSTRRGSVASHQLDLSLLPGPWSQVLW